MDDRTEIEPADEALAVDDPHAEELEDELGDAGATKGGAVFGQNIGL